MEWVWAFFAALWTLSVAALAKWAWRAPPRWRAQGFVENGLGTRIALRQRPRSFSLMLLGIRLFALLGALFALFGAAITLGWIWKAI
ncbi:hypothetical protein ACWPMX_04355 [Tsuneonella sp. HG094]